MKKIISLIILVVAFSGNIFTQHTCGSPSPTAEQYAFTRDVVSQIVLNRNEGTTCIPIRVHDVRKNDGTGGTHPYYLNAALAKANLYFLPAGIEFYFCDTSVDYVDNTNQYNFLKSPSNFNDLYNAADEVYSALNLYLVNSISEIIDNDTLHWGGFAYFPNNHVNSTRMFVVKNTLSLSFDNTFVHELVHCFNLFHTFTGTQNGVSDPNAEHVYRPPNNLANCETKGDLICDTPADPGYADTTFNIESCSYTGTRLDFWNQTYNPDIANTMSYYPSSCMNPYELTLGQYFRIQQGLIIRQNHTAYSLDCPPADVDDPYDLNAVAINTQVHLDWVNVADNEMGILVERSTTSSTSGFKALKWGATGPNGTNFIDYNVEYGETYWYRVKASNDNCND